MLLPSNAKREPDLFSLDIRGLEDRPPFFDIGLLLRGNGTMASGPPVPAANRGADINRMPIDVISKAPGVDPAW